MVERCEIGWDMLQLAFQLIKTALPWTTRSESVLQLYTHNTRTTQHQRLLKSSQLRAALAHGGTRTTALWGQMNN